MKVEEIRKMARKTEIAEYFKSMYQHSIRVLESLSEDQIKNIFRTRTNYNYYGQAEALLFYDWENITKIAVQVVYNNELSGLAETFEVESFFDYRGIRMIFYFVDKAESIGFYIAYDTDDKKKRPFIHSLRNSDYLKTIFGEYLIESTWSEFRVSIKWFED